MARCLRCGHYINQKHGKYCSTCRKALGEVKYKKEGFYKKYEQNTQCPTCFYRWREPGTQDNYYCDYLSMTGMRRPCEPSPKCTEYLKCQ